MCELGAALSTCHAEHLVTRSLPPRLVASDNTDLPDTIQSLVNHLSPLLASSQHSIRLTAYHLMCKLVPRLAQHSTESVIDFRCYFYLSS